MPDIHVPKLDEHGSGKSIFKLVLEVALIGVGVFLGLLGEQWRESSRHRELAEQALRRFRTEVAANRQSVAGVKDYHADRLKDINLFFRTPPAKRRVEELHLTRSAAPAFLDHTAWDLALATQSLTYLDNDLAYAISSAYSAQAVLQGLEVAFLQAIYNRAPLQDPVNYLSGLAAFFGDATAIEPRLMSLYDDALQRIDKALGEKTPVTPPSK
jgi:hypothetical protein